MDAVIGFILIIMPLVFVHELGHYLMARRAGVAVQVFSIGFGPEIFGFFDRQGTRWRLALIPLGGYVKMLGEDTSIEASEAAAYHGKSFEKSGLFSRMAIVLLGPLANILLALCILFVINWNYGVYQAPDYLSAGIGAVVEDSAAAEAGLQVGDVIVAVDQQPVNSFADIAAIMAQSSGEPVIVQVLRGDTTYQYDLSPRVMIDPAGNERLMLGVSASMPKKQMVGVVEAFSHAMKQTYVLGTQILYGIGGLMSGAVEYTQLGGPIKIAEYSGENLTRGIEAFLFFTAMLSVNLAIINLLPIPGLDGGHFLLLLIEGVMRRKPAENIVRLVNNLGIMFVLMLIVLITAKDIFELL